MNTLAEILKRHIWCVITIAAILLLAIITLSFGKDVNLVSHLGLTSAVVSIVLAVIVIVYMYYQDQRSSQNITEMRKLIDEGHRTMTDKARLMVDKAQAIERIMMGETAQPPTDSDTTSTPLILQEGGTLDISLYSNLGLLTLYCLVKSYELRKPIVIDKILKFTQIYNDFAFSMFCLAIIHGLRAFLGKDYVTISAKQQELKKLPDGFKESVIAQIDKRLKIYKDKGKDEDYAELKNAWDLIDIYFNNL